MPKIDKIQLQEAVDYWNNAKNQEINPVRGLYHIMQLLQSAQVVLSGEYVQRDTLASFQSAVAWMREFMPLVLKKKLLELGYVEKSELTNVVGEFLCDKYGEMRKSSIHIQNVRELVDLISGGKNE
jgi:hypothetical protein